MLEAEMNTRVLTCLVPLFYTKMVLGGLYTPTRSHLSTVEDQ